jgi:hypothetical protein
MGWATMETIKLKTHVGDDGLLKLELPTGVTNRQLEVTVILHTLEEGEVDELGWQAGFFERTYGALADYPIERPGELPPDVRDAIE